MKIAFLSDALFPYNHGGKETRLYEISKRLAKKNHSVKIYCMKWWKEDKKSRLFDGVEHVAIAPYIPLYSGQRRSIRQAIVFALYTFGLLWQDFDILDVDHMPFLQLFTAKIVCLLKRKPLIATWHEVWGQSYWKHYLGWLGYIASFIERMSMALPDYIIAVSKKTADDIQGMNVFMRRLVVIPGGVDKKRIQRMR
ncbi:MAG: glycosyltransferase family 4 protein, partial [Patescibacteria group bacterium]|nr:glycosyltransferase family 4 protein [Patescibacteria group bacterium]